MIAANDVEERSIEIRNLLGSGKIPDALKRLMDFISDFAEDNEYRNEVTVISANFRSVETAERRKQLKFQEAQKERNDLLYQALGLLDQVVDTLVLEAA
jgi:hypothetical protein